MMSDKIDTVDELKEMLDNYAKRRGVNYEQAKKDLIEYLDKEFNIDNPDTEEDDLLIDLAEGFFIETRRMTSGANLVTWVGHFVGVNPKVTDRRKNMRTRLAKAYNADSERSLNEGAVGLFTEKNGEWSLTTKQGTTKYEGRMQDGKPADAFESGGDLLAILIANKESPRYLQPMPAYSIGRYAYFLGNMEDQIQHSVQMWRVDLQNEDAEMELQLGRNVSFKAKAPNPNAKEGWADVVNTTKAFADSLVYGDGWVSEELLSITRPERFWVDDDIHNEFVPLDELMDTYEAKKQKISNGEGEFGPVVLTKGVVSQMSTEGISSEYDPSGTIYTLDVTSRVLSSQYSDPNLANVRTWVSGALLEVTKPFHYLDGEEYVGYAERSTVLICARIGVSRRDGNVYPKLTAMGVIGVPGRCRRRITGGDTSVEQFN